MHWVALIQTEMRQINTARYEHVKNVGKLCVKCFCILFFQWSTRWLSVLNIQWNHMRLLFSQNAHYENCNIWSKIKILFLTETIFAHEKNATTNTFNKTRPPIRSMKRKTNKYFDNQTTKLVFICMHARNEMQTNEIELCEWAFRRLSRLVALATPSHLLIDDA